MASSDQLTLSRQIQALFEPGHILAFAMKHYVVTCYETVFKRGQILAPILQSSRVRDDAFGRFWTEFTLMQPSTESESPDKAAVAAASVPRRPNQSSDLIPSILAKAAGIVLDIGPGTGSQIPLLCSPEIKAIYGPEPCKSLHPELSAKIRQYGLENKYHILPCSAEASELLPALKEEGLVSDNSNTPEETGGVFDTIICVRVLCSVPNPEKVVGDLYSLLKPGGKLLVTEHVVNLWTTAKGSLIARFAQSFYEFLGWRHLPQHTI
ncbi:hypothetical protein MPDQ_007746 [Monascus purpureus]|uniref:Methyltransferase type 11 domain-containing protein n=1 Tax=Monascus purpureus TaxID=5098 RepID=A0A507QV90_MONPU|nr:hypothetical protein MPDQ_007746 [Monascus purpureus]